ncbi:MAG: FHA domain-containing protein [Gemmatimonas sp.]
MKRFRGALLALSLVALLPRNALAQKNQQPVPVAPAPPPGPTPAQIAAQADSIRSAEASQVIARCQIRDGVDPPNIRVRCWEAARMGAPTDPRVVDGMLDAQRALDVAEKTASSQAQTKASRDSIETFLARARTDLSRGSLDQADHWITDILAKDATNERALALRGQVSTARVWQSRKDQLKVLAGVVAVLAVGFGLIAKKLFAKRAAAKEAAPAAAATAAPGRKIALKIVDGVGRGRMYTVDSDVFRIGAAESDKKEEKNDLVLSDSLGLVSRFHCALLRRDKKWILVDSSLNGTQVNDKPVARGEQRAVRDGDEITIAGVSRLTFLSM